jgi:bifunctional DNA-binding transcriptional regulator/antitoxin component of YhaV-PrlF toxin-antitoxin module
MSIADLRVSSSGWLAMPDDVRRRWNLTAGGSVEIADLGDALLIVPTGRGLRAMLRDAIEEVGGYAALAAEVAAQDLDLA